MSRGLPAVTDGYPGGGGGGCGGGEGGSDGGAELAGLLRGVLDSVGRPRLSGPVSVAGSKDVVIGNVIHLHTDGGRGSPAPSLTQVRSGAGGAGDASHGQSRQCCE